ncbi:MAG: hypothetical protein NXH83_09300 [Rhodobacteraceae bacterium]|jgi:hypothetical protein|nr:hypothetical protein [Paracoccaceae bacterium]
MRGGGSRYLKEPFDCTHGPRIEKNEEIMALRFATVEARLVRIEALIERLERRVWMIVFGVVAVVLGEAVQSLAGLPAV